MKSKPKTRTGTGHAVVAKSTKQNQTRMMSSDRDPGPSKRTTGNTVGRASKRRKEQEEEVVVVVRSDVDDDGGGGVEEREAERIVVEDIVATSDEDEGRAEVERKVNGKEKGRTNRRMQQRTKPPSSSQQQRSSKVLEVQGSEEEENGGEDVVHIDVPPTQIARNGRGGRVNSATGTEKDKAANGRSRGQGKRGKEESVVGWDEGEDGVAALIERVGRTGTAAANTGTTSKSDAKKDAELARLREQVNQVSYANVSAVYADSDYSFMVRIAAERE